MTASKRPTTKNILQALIRGTDPRTGQELGEDSVFQRIEVVRALIVSLEAVEQTELRASRRSLLPESVGQRWSDDEETRLKEAFQRGETIAALAENHQRTIRAIEARLEKLGLIQASDRTVDFQFQMIGPRTSQTAEAASVASSELQQPAPE